MCELTPKISCSTTTAAFGLPAGCATYAGTTKPSAAFKSTKLPICISFCCNGGQENKLSAEAAKETGLKEVLLVTGGSRGIGAAVALLAAAKGYAVAVNYASNAKAADGVVREIASKGGRAIAVQADVAREEEILAM